MPIENQAKLPRRRHIELGLAVLLLSCFAVLFSACSVDRRPSWVSDEKLELLTFMGVDPNRDFETRGNYYWRWRLSRELRVDGWVCPPGGTVDITRSINVVLEYGEARCVDRNGRESITLKVHANGTAEPLGEMPRPGLE